MTNSNAQLSIHVEEGTNAFSCDVTPFDKLSSGAPAFRTFELNVGKHNVQWFLSGDSAELYSVASTIRDLSDKLFDAARDLNMQELDEVRARAEVDKRSLLESDAWNEGYGWYPEPLPFTFTDEPETQYTREFCAGWRFAQEEKQNVADMLELPND